MKWGKKDKREAQGAVRSDRRKQIRSGGAVEVKHGRGSWDMKWKKGHLGVFQAEGAASSEGLKAGAKRGPMRDSTQATSLIIFNQVC